MSFYIDKNTIIVYSKVRGFMKKIIHLDNSSFFRKVVARFLESMDFEVESYDSWDSAYLAIHAGNVDMIITGLTLVDGEDAELIERILNTFSGPVIVISASVDDQEVADSLIYMGVTGAIAKSSNWKQYLAPYLTRLCREGVPQ